MPGEHLKGWKRTLILDKENNIVLVLDKIQSAKGAQIDLLLHPNVEASTCRPTGAYAALNGDSTRQDGDEVDEQSAAVAR